MQVYFVWDAAPDIIGQWQPGTPNLISVNTSKIRYSNGRFIAPLSSSFVSVGVLLPTLHSTLRRVAEACFQYVNQNTTLLAGDSIPPARVSPCLRDVAMQVFSWCHCSLPQKAIPVLCSHQPAMSALQ